MQEIIGLMGYARSGKDTVGRILVEEHGFTRISFADPLRAIALAINPFIGFTNPQTHQPEGIRLESLVSLIGWDKAKVGYPEVRRLLQAIGTEAGRNILGATVWVDLLEKKIKEKKANYVITDVRFQNEVNVVRGLGGKLWWINRPGVGPLDGHASENSVAPNDADDPLFNDGTIEQLSDKVTELLNQKAPTLFHRIAGRV